MNTDLYDVTVELFKGLPQFKILRFTLLSTLCHNQQLFFPMRHKNMSLYQYCDDMFWY